MADVNNNFVPEATTTAIKESRPKAKNFDSKEDDLILDLFAEHEGLLRSKHNNVVTTQKNNEVLKEICDQVNALGVSQRTVQQIKHKWTNLVVDGKSKNAQMKKSHIQTGGGPSCDPLTAIQEKVISLFSRTPSFSGLSWALESDNFSGTAKVINGNCLSS